MLRSNQFQVFFFKLLQWWKLQASKHLCFWVALIYQPEKYVEATSKDKFLWGGQSYNVTTFIPGPKVKDPFIPAWKLVLWINNWNNFTRKLWQAPISSPLYIKMSCIIKRLNISLEDYSMYNKVIILFIQILTSLEKVHMYFSHSN